MYTGGEKVANRILMDEDLHEKMRALAKKRGVNIIDEYRVAINSHIKERVNEEIARDSGLEIYIDQRITKVDKHLASMMARTGMDTSMVLMGLILLLEKLLKVERTELMDMLRKEGARYFSSGKERK